MRREEDPELWDMLAKATAPELSPFFARNVVRQIRELPSWRDNVLRWLRPRVVIPASAFALALIMSGISLHSKLKDNGAAADNPPETVAVIEPQDYEVVADLDDLLASDDDNVWDENDTLSL